MSRSFRASSALLIFAFLATVGIVGASPTRADDGQSSRFLLDEIEGVTPATLPIGADPNAKVIVMLKLAGDPVALVKAGKPNKQISDSERDSVKASLKSTQDALLPGIAAAGGSVLGQYQSAYNGIKVEIARRSLGSLASLPGVETVVPVARMERDNSTSVPYIGAPQVWDGVKGLHGERIKIGIIDTGIDYTHANFGGPGTPAAYEAAHANETLPADPTLFGKDAPKVKGGIDLVGDAYDPNSSDPAIATPKPDPNPLDCNGHGSHVSGTTAGFGVAADGTTYKGTYDSSLPFSSFIIGPGVAPLADLYAIRVFGCSGATDVTVDAIDWAVDHDMDVINMSLGSSFGRSDDPSAVASDNAARSGVVVVASAGNSGSSPYITGSPATATRAISVAANDATRTYPGASLAFSGGTAAGTTTLASINANGATFANGLTLPVKVLWADAGHTTISLGCNPAEYAGSTGMLVVTARGTCARVARAVFGQQHGAAAVLMVNNATDYPPFEGAITGNPDTGEVYAVTIPFLGVRSTDAAAIKSRDGGSVTLTNAPLANPTFSAVASFSSGGPRLRDSNLKPDVTAPGVSTFSTAVGTGNGGERLSGTSMAAPHVTGVAALVVQAQKQGPRGDDENQNGVAERVKAAIMNTASPTAVAGYKTQTSGSGLVQAFSAVKTRAVAFGDRGTSSLSFGYNESLSTFTATKRISVAALRGEDGSDLRFTAAAVMQAGAPHTVSLSRSSIRLTGEHPTTIDVTLTVPAATTGDANGFRQVAGFIELTPVNGGNNGISLRVPYYLVPRGLTNTDATLSSPFNAANPSGTVHLTNAGGAFAGTADFYAWGISSPNAGHGQTDLRAAGAQSFPASGGRRLIVFAVNTWERFSNAAVNEYDILVDSNGDGVDDFDVFGADNGLIRTGTRDGVFLSGVLNLTTGQIVLTSTAIATDNSTVFIPVFSNRLGLTSASPRFSYYIDVFAGRDGTDDVGSATAKFNAFAPSISTGAFDAVAAGGSVDQAVSITASEWANTPALGVMVVGLDNAAGAAEARLLPVTP